jgi:hypothetical protein
VFYLTCDVYWVTNPPTDGCLSLLPTDDFYLNTMYWVFGKMFLSGLSNVTFLCNVELLLKLKGKPSYVHENLSEIIPNMILGEESRLMSMDSGTL